MVEEDKKPNENELLKTETPKLDEKVELTMLEEAKKVVAEMKETNAETRALVERQERLLANELLGGNSAAGTTTAPPKKELTAKEYKDIIMSGKKPDEK